MSVTVKLKHSSVRDKAPTAGDLTDGELALNVNANSPAAYIKDSAGNIVKLAGSGAVGADDKWTRTGTELAPTNAGDDVFTSGNVKVGNTTGAPNISLNNDGSAEFATSVKVGNPNPLDTKAIGTAVYKGLYETIRPASATPSTKVIRSYYGGDETFFVQTDGSAEFAGSTTINDRLVVYYSGLNAVINSASPTGLSGFQFRSDSGSNASLIKYGSTYDPTGTVAQVGSNGLALTNPDGNLSLTAETTGKNIYFSAGAPTNAPVASINNSGLQIGSPLPSAPNISLNADGSASFAGDITTTRILTPGVTANPGPAGMGAGTDTAGSSRVWVYNNVVDTSLNNAAFAVLSAPNSSTGKTYRAAIYRDGTIEIGTDLLSTSANIILNADGSAEFAGTVTATVVPPSDAKFKENISPASPQLADVVALGNQLKNFDWNADAPVNDEIRAQRQLGLIAQEAEKVCPSLVKTIKRTKQGAELTPETTDEEGNVTPATYEELDDSFKGISHDALIYKLLGAIAELQAEVEALKNK